MTGEGMTGALPVFKDKDDNGYMVFLEEMSERDLERARKMAQNWWNGKKGKKGEKKKKPVAGIVAAEAGGKSA